MTVSVKIEGKYVDLRTLDFIWNEDSITVFVGDKEYKFSLAFTMLGSVHKDDIGYLLK